MVRDCRRRGRREKHRKPGTVRAIEPEVWLPFTIAGSDARVLLVRTAQDAGTIMNAVRQEVWASDSGVALVIPGTLEDFISEQLYTAPRFGFLVMTIFGGIGLILVTVGVYSVLAVLDHPEDARDWRSYGAGGRRLGRSEHGRRVRVATRRGGRRGRPGRESGPRPRHRDSTRGRDRLRSADAGAGGGPAHDDRSDRVLDSGAKSGARRSAGRASRRVAERFFGSAQLAGVSSSRFTAVTAMLVPASSTVPVSSTCQPTSSLTDA